MLGFQDSTTTTDQAVTINAQVQNQPPLLLMVRDKYGNYVAQRLIAVLARNYGSSESSQRECHFLMQRVLPPEALGRLRRQTYGKYIAGSMGKLEKIVNGGGISQNLNLNLIGGPGTVSLSSDTSNSNTTSSQNPNQVINVGLANCNYRKHAAAETSEDREREFTEKHKKTRRNRRPRQRNGDSDKTEKTDRVTDRVLQ